MKRARGLWALALLALAGMLFACHREPPPAAPVRALPLARRIVDAGYHAGVARVDVTPPPHLALFGHGPEGRIATGFRLRLRCEAYVVAQGDELVALVPCDLAAPSLKLQREVVRRLNELGVPVPVDRLLLMATHTHAGPAHYFEAHRYSGAFSSYAPGYDRGVVDFLAERVAAAVAEAYAKLAPACLSWRNDALAGLTFNRSYPAFVRNFPAGGEGDVPALVRAADQERALRRGGAPAPALAPPAGAAPSSGVAPAGAAPATGGAPAGAAPSSSSAAAGLAAGAAPAAGAGLAAPAAGPPPTAAESAVDPAIDVLRIDARPAGRLSCEAEGRKPLGVFAVFGMHPTAVPNTNDLYHGDVFGFAARTAEACLFDPEGGPGGPAPWRCETKGPGDGDVVVGLANGIEGDVSPKVTYQSVAEARRLGRLLGLKIVELAEDRAGRFPLNARGELGRAYWELSFPGAPLGPRNERALCPHGELGVAAAGGARDGPTRARLLAEANAGYRLAAPGAGCHGVKLPLTSFLDDHALDFPRLGPIAIVRLDRGVLATAPGEMTTVTGQRIREAVRSRLRPEPASPLGAGPGGAPPAPSLPVVGLTNSYLQYFATRDEYELQLYEGASTLYGPDSSQFLVQHFGCLADSLQGGRAAGGRAAGGQPGGCRNRSPMNAAQPFDASPTPVVERLPKDDDDFRPRQFGPIDVRPP
ncbi:MAG TPA: neutral/alkaline non-lysosomal ceramidase N-terminal domain-containing protein, partial [Polyangiaceae bacterium]|nr:neutral/alkaline non-lysosomal ceramidase N-terminal domain-containing protein [Polyangiaceae bacterium]